MKRHIGFCALALLVPLSAWAQLNGNATVSANSGFNFDTGQPGNGDITYTGSAIVFNGSSKGGNLGPLGISGSAAFNGPQTSQTVLQSLAAFASNTPIPASTITAGTSNGSIIALQTNGGNAAKFLVTAISSSSISFQYVTYGVSGSGGGGGAPTVKSVVNNSSLIPAAFRNSGIAPSTIFQIQGSNMASATTVSALQDSSKGLPTTLNGATVTIQSGSKTWNPGLYYAIATQIAAVMPHDVPPGPVTVTVAFNNNGSVSTSAPFNVNVVPAAFGMDVYNGNYAVLQDSITGAIITPTNSAKPGETLTLWGSGLGADQGLTDTTSSSNQQKINTPLQVYIGSVQVQPGNLLYEGSLVYPGVNGIVFTVPQNVGQGCFLSVAVVTNANNNSVTSNIGTASFMPDGGVCQDPYTGFSGNSVATITGGSVKSGFVSIFQSSNQSPNGSTSISDSGFASFQQVSGSSVLSDANSSTSLGSCSVSQTVLTTGGMLPTVTGLNAGTLTITPPSGPAVTMQSFPQVPGSYQATLNAGAVPANGGAFTVAGSGATGPNSVGPFSTVINFSSPIVWTNQAANATVTLSQGQTYQWTGGAPGTFVIMSGSSSSPSLGISGFYTCVSPAEAHSFTVPAYILNTLPAGSGSSSVENSTAFTPFTATGLDFGFALGAVSFQINSTFQ